MPEEAAENMSSVGLLNLKRLPCNLAPFSGWPRLLRTWLVVSGENCWGLSIDLGMSWLPSNILAHFGPLES